MFGFPVLLTLDDKTRAKSGTGTGSVDAGLHLPVSERTHFRFALACYF